MSDELFYNQYYQNSVPLSIKFDEDNKISKGPYTNIKNQKWF